MSRTIGVVSGIALMVLAVSLVAQSQAPSTAPAATAVPPGLPEWAYTPPVPGAPSPPSALPNDDAAAVTIPGADRTFTRG